VVQAEGVEEALPVGVVSQQGVAVAVRRSIRPATASLWGMVTDRPPIIRARIPAMAPAVAPARTGKARKAQSRPAARKAALWRTGESEWRIGYPMTAATRVAPVGQGEAVSSGLPL
jgi:hypothetical protein